ncbi:MAG: TaqI-like C-terminal specificity domain-containing protein, partial [Bacteroidia bacterium]
YKRQDLSRYQHEKIVIRQLGSTINANLDTNNSISVQSVYNVYSETEMYTNKVLLALLNSKVLEFVYQNVFAEKQQFPRILIENIKSLCVPQVNKTTTKKIETFVDKILALKATNPKADTTKLEQQIDAMVYNLYELTPNEIAIVEGNK